MYGWSQVTIQENSFSIFQTKQEKILQPHKTKKFFFELTNINYTHFLKSLENPEQLLTKKIEDILVSLQSQINVEQTLPFQFTIKPHVIPLSKCIDDKLLTKIHLISLSILSEDEKTIILHTPKTPTYLISVSKDKDADEESSKKESLNVAVAVGGASIAISTVAAALYLRKRFSLIKTNPTSNIEDQNNVVVHDNSTQLSPLQRDLRHDINAEMFA